MKSLKLLLLLTLLTFTGCSSDDDQNDVDNDNVLGEPVNTLNIQSGPLAGSYRFPNITLTEVSSGGAYIIDCGEHEGNEQVLTFRLNLPTNSFPLNQELEFSGTFFLIEDVTANGPDEPYSSSSLSILVTRKFLLENSNNDFVIDLNYSASMSDGLGGDAFMIEGSFTNLIVEDCANC